MKKIMSLATAVTIAFAVTACSASGLKSGTYTKEATDFDDKGWKDIVTINVDNGKIASAVWLPVDDAGTTKKASSESGDYSMMANSDAQSEWHDQAKLVEDKLIETQDPLKLDGITGVSIDISGFKTLAIEALNDAK